MDLLSISSFSSSPGRRKREVQRALARSMILLLLLPSAPFPFFFRRVATEEREEESKGNTWTRATTRLYPIRRKNISSIFPTDRFSDFVRENAARGGGVYRNRNGMYARTYKCMYMSLDRDLLPTSALVTACYRAKYFGERERDRENSFFPYSTNSRSSRLIVRFDRKIRLF